MSTRHDFEKNYAIIIGINNYADKPLRAAKNDAEKLAQILGAEERKEDEEYRVLLLTDGQATHSKLTELLGALKEGKIHFPEKKETVELKERNRLLIYFSGHGVASSLEDSQKNRTEAEREKILNKQFLQCQDGKKLPLKDLFDALKPLNCRHLLLILDCCFAGQAINNTGLEEVSVFRTASFDDETEIKYERQYQLMFKQRAWTAITSSGYEEAVDYTNPNQTYSYFAQSLFKVLEYNTAKKAADSNDDDIITDNEIFTYIKNDQFVNKYQSPQKFTLTFTGKKQSGQYFFLLPDFEPAQLGLIENTSSPYKGLFSYEKDDTHIFKGRNRLVNDLFERVYNKKQKLTVVTGVSGSGKSSLVKAGLIAKIEKENNLSQSDPSNNYELWKICEPIRPSESPFKALVDAVEAPGEYENKKILDLSEKFYEKLEQYSRTQKSFLIAGQSSQNKKNLEEVEDAFNSLTKELSHQVSNEQNFLLVIDQFEELVTLCQPLEQEYFLKLLVQILKESQALRLVLTVRSDFEIYFRGSSTTSDSESSTTGSDISQYWNKEARLLVDEMSIDELRQAIEKPARLFGVDFESEQLVNDIIDDVRGMPGALALLSFTLEKLYQMAKDQMAKGSSSQNNREPITITRAHYQELGGVVKALTNKATEVYDKLGQKIEEENKGEFTQKYIKEFGKTPAEDESAGEVRQAMMKQLILRMVTTQGGKLAKRPVPISELQYPDWRSRYKNATYHMCQVIDQLIKERLIVSNSYESNKGNNNEEICYVEPAHDALILYWDKLHKKDETEQQQEQNNLVQKQGWLEEEEDILVLRDRLIAAIQDWHKWEEERKKTPPQFLRTCKYQKQTIALFNKLNSAYIFMWEIEIRYRISRKIRNFLLRFVLILGLEVLPILFGLGFIAVSVERQVNPVELIIGLIIGLILLIFGLFCSIKFGIIKIMLPVICRIVRGVYRLFTRIIRSLKLLLISKLLTNNQKHNILKK